MFTAIVSKDIALFHLLDISSSISKQVGSNSSEPFIIQMAHITHLGYTWVWPVVAKHERNWKSHNNPEKYPGDSLKSPEVQSVGKQRIVIRCEALRKSIFKSICDSCLHEIRRMQVWNPQKTPLKNKAIRHNQDERANQKLKSHTSRIVRIGETIRWPLCRLSGQLIWGVHIPQNDRYRSFPSWIDDRGTKILAWKAFESVGFVKKVRSSMTFVQDGRTMQFQIWMRTLSPNWLPGMHLKTHQFWK